MVVPEVKGMSAKPLVLALVAALVSSNWAAVAGNYYECPKDDWGRDNCHDDDDGATGICMVMAISPSPSGASRYGAKFNSVA